MVNVVLAGIPPAFSKLGELSDVRSCLLEEAELVTTPGFLAFGRVLRRRRDISRSALPVVPNMITRSYIL